MRPRIYYSSTSMTMESASARIPALARHKVSQKAQETLDKVAKFVQEKCIPADEVYAQQLGSDHRKRFSAHPQVLEDLKAEAKQLGLWNLFLPKGHFKEHGGYTNIEYGLMAEQLGQSTIASMATNCSAPDTGNMELLAKFGNSDQKKQWLAPLLDGKIRSAFLMTEPNVASSDATNIQFSIRREGNDYVLNGSKWWASGAGDPTCEVYLVMGKTDPNNPDKHRQQSVVVVPARTPGITVNRMMSVFGYDDAPHGHGHLTFNNVRVPISNIVSGEGRGFEIIQARLGPGRIHHAMRSVGAAERALDLIISRIHEPTKKPFGKMLHESGLVMNQIAELRLEINSARLSVLEAAIKIDEGDAKAAMQEIAIAKVHVPRVLLRAVDYAIQIYGAAGISQDTPLAYMMATARTMRIVDGPDEVHLLQLGKQESKRASAVRSRLVEQEAVSRDLMKSYNLYKADPLHLGWTWETKPKL